MRNCKDRARIEIPIKSIVKRLEGAGPWDRVIVLHYRLPGAPIILDPQDEPTWIARIGPTRVVTASGHRFARATARGTGGTRILLASPGELLAVCRIRRAAGLAVQDLCQALDAPDPHWEWVY